jgi:hypothetical protein
MHTCLHLFNADRNRRGFESQAVDWNLAVRRASVTAGRNHQPYSHSSLFHRGMPSGRLILLLLAGLAGGHACAANHDTPPITPTKPIVLYDGKAVADLSQFYTWLGPLGYEDPNRVFTVVDWVDGGPAIRVSGQDWGGIVTRQNYRDYRLVLEYRWGSVTWGQRKTRARNSGVLLHCQGEDGSYRPDFQAPWLVSVEYEILEGRTGDVILVGGFKRGGTEKILPTLVMRAKPGDFYWDPQGTPREFVSGKGHLHWYGRDRAWKDELGFRGPQDVERPVGQWNRAEIVAQGGDLTYFLNGVKILEATESSLKHGRILFQSEGAEIFFRLIALEPLAR